MKVVEIQRPYADMLSQSSVLEVHYVTERTDQSSIILLNMLFHDAAVQNQYLVSELRGTKKDNGKRSKRIVNSYSIKLADRSKTFQQNFIKNLLHFYRGSISKPV